MRQFPGQKRSVFLHFSLWHLLFNLLWLQDLGAALEVKVKQPQGIRAALRPEMLNQRARVAAHARALGDGRLDVETDFHRLLLGIDIASRHPTLMAA